VPTEAVNAGFDFEELTGGPNSGRWIVIARDRDVDTWRVNTTVTDDEGESWEGPFTVAGDPELQLCEPDVLQLPTGELVCFLREDSRQGLDHTGR